MAYVEQVDRKAARNLLKYYITGFVLSLMLTIDVFIVVMKPGFNEFALPLIVVLAALQSAIQLIFFLHLGRGSRWNTVVFLFMLLVVFILVVGSLWIMANLDYNMMTPESTDQYMKEAGQKGI